MARETRDRNSRHLFFATLALLCPQLAPGKNFFPFTRRVQRRHKEETVVWIERAVQIDTKVSRGRPREFAAGVCSHPYRNPRAI